MFFEEGLPSTETDFNETVVVVTKYLQPSIIQTVFLPSPTTLTLTLTSTVTTTATSTVVADTPRITLNVPHHPQVDTAFTATFGTLCLVLIGGVILRRKSKQLKGFNIPLILGTFFDALGHFFHADYSFLSTKYELGRVVRIILTLAPIFYSLALFSLHRKTRNRHTVRSAMVFSSLAGIHVLYCLIAAFGDGAVLFYTEQTWGEMDVAKHLAVSQVFGQQFLLCIMSGMWLRGRNVTHERGRSLRMEDLLALVTIPAILGALVVRVSAQLILIIRNDKCYMVYEVLERSAEIQFTSSAALFLAVLTCVVSQGWLWRIEWKRRDEKRQQEEESKL